jgi:pectate lyase
MTKRGHCIRSHRSTPGFGLRQVRDRSRTPRYVAHPCRRPITANPCRAEFASAIGARSLLKTGLKMVKPFRLACALLAAMSVASVARAAPPNVQTAPADTPPAAGLVQSAQASASPSCASRFGRARNAAERADLLSHMHGFAAVAGTTGGLQRPVYMVTSLGDLGPDGRAVPGSLRAAVEQASKTDGGWIEFSQSLPAKPQITLAKRLTLTSNTTVDGACTGAEILTTKDREVFLVSAIHNVVIAGLSMRKIPAPNATVRDCISITDGADAVWVAYNRFNNCGDGTVDVTQPTMADHPSRVTIANNIFENHNKVILIATLDCGHPGPPPWCKNPALLRWNWALGNQVTLEHNLFLGTIQRHPRVSGLSYVHSLGNVVLYQNYGAFVAGGGWLLSQGDLYIPMSSTRRSRALATADDPDADEHAQSLGHGAVRAVDLTIVSPGMAELPNAREVPDPSYGLPFMHKERLSVSERVQRAARQSGPGAIPTKPDRHR